MKIEQRLITVSRGSLTFTKFFFEMHSQGSLQSWLDAGWLVKHIVFSSDDRHQKAMAAVIFERVILTEEKSNEPE